MSLAPLVSVVTPVYNGADFIAECIESVLRQTHQNFEYIIVNNCSTDATLEIASSYARKDSRITVHDNTAFVGVIENHNLAFRLISSASKYCKVVSGDDWIFPDCLTQMVELADANPSVGIVGSYSLAGKDVVWDGLDYSQKVISGPAICRATLLGGPYVFGAPTTLLYRSDLLRKGKDFFPGKSPHADTSACYEALEHSDFGFVHQVLSYTRIHAESQTSSSLKFGTINRSLIADMDRFGPRYLSPEEFKRELDIRLEWYYDWLIPALSAHAFDKKFLEVQRKGLREIGFELSYSRMLKSGLMRGAQFMQSPGVMGSRFLAKLKKRGKVTAAYY